MDFDQIARKSRELAYEGKEFDEILNAISITTLSKDDQKKLRSLIDDFIVQYELAAQVKGKYKTQMLLAAVAVISAVFILLLAYFRNELNYSAGIGIALGLIGLKFLKEGFDKYKAPIEIQQVIPKKDSKFHRY